MLAALILTLVSSIEIPILYKENKNANNLLTTSLADSKGNNRIYLGDSYNYYVNVVVGEDSLSLSLDLLNPETRVALAECKCTSYANVYNPGKTWYSSSAYGDNYDTSTEEYKLYKDKMSIKSFSTNYQLLLTAKKHPKYLEGISGSLGLRSSSNFHDENFIKNLRSQIGKEIFSITLENPYNSKHDSIFTVGEENFSKYSQGPVKSIRPRDKYDRWGFEIDGVSYDNNYFSWKSFPAVMDINTQYLGMPKDEYNDLIKKIGSSGCFNQGLYTCYCEPVDLKRFPNITLKVWPEVYTVTPQDYVIYYEDFCYVAVIDSGIQEYILGAPFFYGHYVAFDMWWNEIRIAKVSNFRLGNTALAQSESISYSTFGIIGVAGIGLLAWKIKRSRKTQKELYEAMIS